MFSLLYGSGLRKAELLRLRIKDIDFSSNSIYVFRGKGAKDRITLLPQSLVSSLKTHINYVESIHKKKFS
jgi:integrase